MTRRYVLLTLLLMGGVLVAGITWTKSGHRAPDMVCHQSKTVYINPQSFNVDRVQTVNIEEMDTYAILNGELYLSPPASKSYRYNKLVEVEEFRYYAGHKTLLFNQDYSELITTHTYNDDIRVGKFRCSPIPGHYQDANKEIIKKSVSPTQNSN